mgnify:CR=1 FL=1
MLRLNRARMMSNNKQGFIILFTVVFLTVILTVVSAASSAIYSDRLATEREGKELQSQYAADTALECVNFYDSKSNAFDTMSPAGTYDCGVGTFTAGGVNAGPDCVAHTYPSFQLDGFPNGACADVVVHVEPRIINLGGILKTICDLDIKVEAQNTCNSTARNRVQTVLFSRR